MKCPLINNDCLKEECGRWDKVRGQCADLSILEELRLLVGAAAMIADKMPTSPTIRK